MIEPVKLGITLEPPAIVLVYKTWGKLRLRKMPVRNLWPNTSTKFILDDIRTRHDVLKKVPDALISKMVDILKALKAGVELKDAVATCETNMLNTSDRVVDHIINKLKIDVDVGESKVNGKDKPYSFMDKRLGDEDTDFDLNDDLPLDELDGNSDEDFWR